MPANPIRSMRVLVNLLLDTYPNCPPSFWLLQRWGVEDMPIGGGGRATRNGWTARAVCDDRPARGRAFPSRCLTGLPKLRVETTDPARLPSSVRAKAKRSSCSIVKAPCGLASGPHDIAIVDTPPEEHGGHLPGVLLVAITDGTDAARNLLTMLQGTPDNTDIMLVPGVAGTERSLGPRRTHHRERGPSANGLFEDPLPKSDAIKDAHDSGESIWSLRRTGPTLEVLERSRISGVLGMATTRFGAAMAEMPSPRPPNSTSGMGS